MKVNRIFNVHTLFENRKFRRCLAHLPRSERSRKYHDSPSSHKNGNGLKLTKILEFKGMHELGTSKTGIRTNPSHSASDILNGHLIIKTKVKFYKSIHSDSQT